MSSTPETELERERRLKEEAEGKAAEMMMVTQQVVECHSKEGSPVGINPTLAKVAGLVRSTPQPVAHPSEWGVCDKHVNAIIHGCVTQLAEVCFIRQGLARRVITKWRHYDGPRVILWDTTNRVQNTKMAACSEQHGAHIMVRIASRVE
jgi:hypothetical protein